jgi:hypothetical protein
MQNLRVLLAIGASVAAVAVACSSSSSNPATTPVASDAGGDSATTDDASDDSSSMMGATCIPLGTTGCAKGQECCLKLSGGLMGGSCVAPGSCTGNIQVECEKGADCASGQVCCASLGGASLAAVQDAGLAALGIDASSLSLDAGAAGLGALGSVSFSVTCQQSCTSSEIQACGGAGECAGGGACVPVSMLFGDGGLMVGDGGVPAGLAMYAGALMGVMACTAPAMDAGMTMSAPDAGGADGAGTVDAVAPTDGPADAVSE